MCSVSPGIHAFRPCAACFGRHPCYIPDYSIGQDLRLTIESVSTIERPPDSDDHGTYDASDHKLDTLRAMFDALRACSIALRRTKPEPACKCRECRLPSSAAARSSPRRA